MCEKIEIFIKKQDVYGGGITLKILFNVPTEWLQEAEKEEYSFLTNARLEKLKEKFNVVLNNESRHFTKEELIEKISDADAVITHWGSTKIDEEVLSHAKKLKIVAHLAGTVKSYVCEEVFDKGIKVISANDTYFARSVAEGVLAYALVGLRRIDRYSMNLKNMRENGWKTRVSDYRGLMRKKVGIVSFGAVAKHFVDFLKPFDCRILVYSRSISDETLNEYGMERASLDEIFETCDVISIHTALNEKTRHFINRDLLSKIKDGALLINTSRGAVIDEQALVEELENNRFYAVLDVFEKEPLPGNSKLYDFENVALFPHKAGPTLDMRNVLTNGILDEVTEFLLNGKEPKSILSKERAVSMSFN